MKLHEPHLFPPPPCPPTTGLIASNGVNGSPRTEEDPKGSGIQVRRVPEFRSVPEQGPRVPPLKKWDEYGLLVPYAAPVTT
jgi:hypothetical protein